MVRGQERRYSILRGRGVDGGEQGVKVVFWCQMNGMQTVWAVGQSGRRAVGAGSSRLVHAAASVMHAVGSAPTHAAQRAAHISTPTLLRPMSLYLSTVRAWGVG